MKLPEVLRKSAFFFLLPGINLVWLQDKAMVHKKYIYILIKNFISIKKKCDLFSYKNAYSVKYCRPANCYAFILLLLLNNYYYEY